MKNIRPGLVAIIMAAAFVLSACSDDTPPQTSTTPPPDDQVKNEPPPGPLPLDAPNRFVSDGKVVGIGPFWQGESPASLDNATEYDEDFTFHSGPWRGARDGNSSASTIIEFLQSFNPEDGAAGYVIPDFGNQQKTLKISGATDDQKRAVENALRMINAALPWDKRIKLDLDNPVTGPFDPAADIPANEIHMYFTEGKEGWPEEEDGNGWSKAKIDDESYVVLSGFSLIDAAGVMDDEADLQAIITRELLRAYGIVVHAMDNVYPDSRLLAGNRPVFLALEGETLLAITRLTPGTDVEALKAGDFGSWETTGFHLVGTLDLAEGQEIQFGVGFRNGLGKPWALGPVPEGSLGANEDLQGEASATWSGYLLGFTIADGAGGNPVTGTAEIEIDFSGTSPTGTASFRDLEYWDPGTAPGAMGDGMQWTGGSTDGELDYTIGIVKNEDGHEGFESTSALGDDDGDVSGIFVGDNHEGTIGTVERLDLSAGFGATRAMQQETQQ